MAGLREEDVAKGWRGGMKETLAPRVAEPRFDGCLEAFRVGKYQNFRRSILAILSDAPEKDMEWRQPIDHLGILGLNSSFFLCNLDCSQPYRTEPSSYREGMQGSHETGPGPEYRNGAVRLSLSLVL